MGTNRLMRRVALLVGLLMAPSTPMMAQSMMVQVGAYRDLAAAQSNRDSLESSNSSTLTAYDIFVERVDLDSGIWYRLLIGPFPDSTTAGSVCGRIKDEGVDCFAVTVASSLMPLFDTRLSKLTLDNTVALDPAIEFSVAAPARRDTVISSISSAELNDENGVPIYERYRIAAEEGDAVAQFFLAQIFDYGRGVSEDNEAAVYWYRKAALQDFGKAQHNLGAMYGNGEGVTQDLVLAYMWFSISTHSLSGEERERARSHVFLAAQLLSPEDRSRAASMVGRCRVSEFQECEDLFVQEQ